MANPSLIDARPSKRFFIDMLTRDITVADCILDLIDNAVDKAVEVSGVDVMDVLDRKPVEFEDDPNSKPRVEITFDGQFRMSDNCGGISKKEASTEVFLFGSQPTVVAGSTGLSVYGIGMKRALFKLGRNAVVRSSDGSDDWQVNIDVDRWQRHRRWTLDFTPRTDERPALIGERATTIVVDRLTDQTTQLLGQPSFWLDLRRRIATTYALFIEAGLDVFVNDERVEATLPVLSENSVTPGRRLFDHQDVSVLIIVGVSPRDDENAHGWYVFCNGRMVLEADQGMTTGWGDLLPQFRSKYNHFVGFVYFRSDHVSKLPWRTTKQGVDPESDVYRAALVEMRLQARPVLDFLNDLYPSEAQEDPVLEREVLRQAQPVRIDQISLDDQPFQVRHVSRTTSDTVSIQFRRPRSLIDRLKEYLGSPEMSARQVGEHAFDVFARDALREDT